MTAPASNSASPTPTTSQASPPANLPAVVPNGTASGTSAPILTVLATPIQTRISELRSIQERASQMQKEIADEQSKNLREVHVALGFATPEDFLIAYREANPMSLPGRSSNARRTVEMNVIKKNGSGQRKPRVTITPERAAQIIKFFKNEGSTIDAVQKFDISIATAQNYKDKAGMVNRRK